MTHEQNTTEPAPEEAKTTRPQDEAVETDVNEPETFDRDYVKKLRDESAKYRTRAKELEAQFEEQKKAAERAKMDEVEAAKAEAADLKAQLEAAQDAARKANWRATLSGKVADANAAIKLLEDKHLTEDGDVNVDALLGDYAFLAPATPGRTPVTPANTASKKDGPLTPADFVGKDRQWVRENMHRLKRD